MIYESKTSELKDELLNETDIGPEIVHEYKLINKGPSQFLRSELLIAWQKEIKNSMKSSSSPFLYLMESPYTEGPISCFTQYLDINTHNFSVIIFVSIIFILNDITLGLFLRNRAEISWKIRRNISYWIKRRWVVAEANDISAITISLIYSISFRLVFIWAASVKQVLMSSMRMSNVLQVSHDDYLFFK